MRVLKQFTTFCAVALLGLTGCMSQDTHAETTATTQKFDEGFHYDVLKSPVTTQTTGDKVEVAELFWYSCPHCYQLEPTVDKYKAQMPDNVEFVPVPATLSPNWRNHAMLYYVGQMLDPEGKKELHKKIFSAIHGKPRRTGVAKGDAGAIKRFLQSLGYSKDTIDKAYGSMLLKTKMSYTDRYAADLSSRTVNGRRVVDSVPTIIVNGKYVTSPSRLEGGSQELIDVINYLTTLQ